MVLRFPNFGSHKSLGYIDEDVVREMRSVRPAGRVR
jgi:hypothetical protein